MRLLQLRKLIIFSCFITCLTPVKLIFAQATCSSLFTVRDVSKRNNEILKETTLNPEQIRLKKEIEHYDQQFSRYLESDLDKLVVALRKEHSHGEQKLELMRRLGFHFSSGKNLAPTFTEFLKNYIALLDKAGVPENDRLLPAITIAKQNLRGLYESEFLFTPGIDPWPSMPGFHFMNQFDVSSITVVKAQARGRYPFIFELHDVFHFMTFASGVGYAKFLKKSISSLSNPDDPKMLQKINYVNEVLTLTDPKKEKKILENLVLASEFVAGQELNLSDFMQAFEKISDHDIVSYAEKLAVTFSQFTITYGGAVSLPTERDRLASVAADEILRGSQGRYRSDKYGVVDIALGSAGTFAPTLRGLINYYHKPMPNSSMSPTPEQVLQAVRSQLARMEYFLWYCSTKKITVEVFLEGFIRNDNSVDPGLEKFLREIFSKDSLLANQLF